MNQSLLHTLTLDNENSLMWSFASVLNRGLTEDEFGRLHNKGFELTQVSLVALPLAVLALLQETTLPEIIKQMAGSPWDESTDQEAFSSSRAEVRFAETVLTQALIPIGLKHQMPTPSRVQSQVELLSLADLISESSSPPTQWINNSGGGEEETIHTQLFLGSREGKSFMILNHPRAVILGGRFEAYQFFNIWRTFLDWLFN
ncbi:MAG: hypothetical protein AABN34_16890 [Acidobacteriota bacterium]